VKFILKLIKKKKDSAFAESYKCLKVSEFDYLIVFVLVY